MSEEDDSPLESSFGNLVRNIHRLQANFLQSRLAEDGVSLGCWHFLRVLWEEDMITQRELSQRSGLNEATTRTAVDRMEDEKLVVRRNDPNDRRKRIIQLTDRARDLRPSLLGFSDELNERILEPLPTREQRRFMIDLVRVHDHIKAMAAGTNDSGIDQVS